MLVRLFGRNFRSLKNDFELSMVAADLTREEDRDRGTFEVRLDGFDEPLRLLRAIGIYGANASGKSTVLMAGRALRSLATESIQRKRPDAPIREYKPFLLDDAAREEPILLGCDVVHKKSILRYEVVFDQKSIQEERLTRLDGDGECVLIDRRGTEPIGGDLIKKSEANQLYVKEMHPNATVLSKLSSLGPDRGPESAKPYYQSIRSALNYEDYAPAATMQRVDERPRERFANNPKYRAWVMQHLMQEADVGICSVNTREKTVEIPPELRALVAASGESFRFPDKTVEISFVHSGASDQELDFSAESSGTKKLFNISDDWWRLANRSISLFADELGASLHPRLLDRLIRVANEPRKTNSQLIFTTHETGLLESHNGLPPALRRDQVYFTRKDSRGATELYSLTEFKEDARPVHNIRKRYLSGQYGAIPSVEGLSL